MEEYYTRKSGKVIGINDARVRDFPENRPEARWRRCGTQGLAPGQGSIVSQPFFRPVPQANP